ncbi:MFS transporter [Purpureocillium lavendulum]|uniref:MFS transporter n=1 Tax=Purpureocillium lavendulum TaxID=1247861 RepID=A0AB34FYQ6_9HYPO|nr:MFS transporter [Purpureocillium lavendulum]
MTTTTTTVTEEPIEAIELSRPRSKPSEPPPLTGDGPSSQPRNRHGRADYLKLMSAGFSFFVAGVNDGSLGALIPYLIREYAISTAIVSSVYGANFSGWLTSALTNTHLCQSLDLGAMLALGAVLQIIAHALRAWDPPFGLFVVTFWLASLGQAYQDTHGNTFAAGRRGAHRWLAFIHAMYMAGCLVGPFVSTAIASAGATSKWYLFYTFPLGIGVANLVLVLFAFRDSLRFKKPPPACDEAEPGTGNGTLTDGSDGRHVSRNKGAMALIKETVRLPNIWLLCTFFFFYLGAVLTASGWVVEYLVDVRDGKLSQMGYVPAGFNGGALLGRLLLAEPTHRFGERRMVLGYVLISIALQLVFWLVPNIIAASIAVSFIGFFTGPLFATGISLGSKLFPAHLHSTALALVFVFAQMGGCLFPIVTGVVSSNAGVKVLQPILVALLAATAISWLLVPRPKASENAELHQE